MPSVGAVQILLTTGHTSFFFLNKKPLSTDGGWRLPDGGWMMANCSYCSHSPAGGLWRFECTRGRQLFSFVLRTAPCGAEGLRFAGAVGVRVLRVLRAVGRRGCREEGHGGSYGRRAVGLWAMLRHRGSWWRWGPAPATQQGAVARLGPPLGPLIAPPRTANRPPDRPPDRPANRPPDSPLMDR